MAYSAKELLEQSKEIYDDENNRLKEGAREASKGSFTGGARWMMQALRCLRNDTNDLPQANYELLGCFKYGLALLAGLGAGGVSLFISPFIAPFSFILTFYAVEAQFVFLFPIVIDRNQSPFCTSLVLAKKAGGTFKVMRTVMPIALFMLTGGFIGKGFLRSWCIGCLAIVIWYEAVRE